MTNTDIQEYEFYLGFKGQNLKLPDANNNNELINIKIRPWHLRHVLDFGVSIDSQSTEIGIPTKPPEEALIFDMSGPVREFNISGVRYDYEEEVSNMDFMFKNTSPKYSWETESGGIEEGCVSVGITTMFSLIQASIPGFYFGIFSSINSNNPSAGEDYSGVDLIETGHYNVALSGVNFEYLKNPGGISYNFTLIERREMGRYNYNKILKV